MTLDQELAELSLYLKDGEATAAAVVEKARVAIQTIRREIEEKAARQEEFASAIYGQHNEDDRRLFLHAARMLRDLLVHCEPLR